MKNIRWDVEPGPAGVPLHVFEDEWGMHVIATDIRDAGAVAAYIFDDTDILEEKWTQTDDEEELTIRNVSSSEDDSPVTKTAKDWTAQGRGHLANTEAGTWWLRGRHWTG